MPTRADVMEQHGYHHGDLRHELVVRALAIVARDGLSGLSLRSVAKEIGVSNTAVYRHFVSKDELVAEVRAAGIQRLGATLLAACRPLAEPCAELAAVVTAYQRFAAEQRQLFGVLFHPGLPECPGLYEAVQPLLLAARRAGTEGVRAISTGLAEDAAWELTHGRALLLLTGRSTANGQAAGAG